MSHHKNFIGYTERLKKVKVYSRMVLLLSILMVMFNVVTVFAEGSLSDMTNDKQASTDNPTGGLLQGLDDSMNFSDVEDETTARVKEPLKRAFGIIVQIGSYILTFGIVAITVLDLLYVCIPPLQPILGRGQMGMPIQGAPQGQPGMGGPMGGGMMGGMGSPMGGMGMGGMGMRSGMMGGMGSPMGGMGMGGMGGMQQGMQQPQMGGWCWVTKAALNSVASSGMPDATGKPMNSLKIYFKEATIQLVVAPIILTLAVTGVLGSLGFAIGSLIGGAIQAGIGMM